MNKNKLIEVLKIQSESYNQWRMFAYLIRQLKAAGCQYYTYNGCIYATKGSADLYPCIVAHMDTVHDIVEDRIWTDYVNLPKLSEEINLAMKEVLDFQEQHPYLK